MMRVEIVSTTPALESLEKDWNDLCAQSSADSVYLTWEWLQSWWEVYGDAQRCLHVILIRDDAGPLLAIAPFCVKTEQRFGLRKNVLQFLGTGEDSKDEVCSNYLDVVARENASEAVALIVRHLADGLAKGWWDELDFKSVAQESVFLRSLQESSVFKGLTVTAPQPCAVISLPDRYEDYFTGLSKKWRDQLKRGNKELATLGQIVWQTASSGDELNSLFAEFKDLHQRKWEAQGSEGLFSSARFSRFHEQILRRFGPKGWVSVRMLKVNGQSAAASYKLEYRGCVYFYLPALNKEIRTKVGLGILERSVDIEDAIKRGMKRYDFYKAKEGSYKWHFAKDRCFVVDARLSKAGLKMLCFRMVDLLFKVLCRLGIGK